MNKQFVLILVAIAVVLGGIFWVTSNSNGGNNTGNKNSAEIASSSDAIHLRGDKESPVTFVEFGDFQCPACEAYYPLVEQVFAKYQDRVAFQFREYPLPQLHPHAVAAARAAEAAGLQGQFWPMYHKLYEDQKTWVEASSPVTIFNQYAQSMGLDVSQFDKDLKSSKVNDIVNADKTLGQTKYNVSGTPTFVINDTPVQQAPTDVAGFSKFLDKALAEHPKTTQKATDNK